jgi:hypothetical protein
MRGERPVGGVLSFAFEPLESAGLVLAYIDAPECEVRLRLSIGEAEELAKGFAEAARAIREAEGSLSGSKGTPR